MRYHQKMFHPMHSLYFDAEEDSEYAVDHARGVKHIPMADIPERYQEINPDPRCLRHL